MNLFMPVTADLETLEQVYAALEQQVLRPLENMHKVRPSETLESKVNEVRSTLQGMREVIDPDKALVENASRLQV